MERSNSAFEGEPCAIPFLEVTKNETLQLSSQAMFLLSQMKTRKVSIVVFGGTKSSGKSFLANQYVDCSRVLPTGFKLSHM